MLTLQACEHRLLCAFLESRRSDTQLLKKNRSQRLLWLHMRVLCVHIVPTFWGIHKRLHFVFMNCAPSPSMLNECPPWKSQVFSSSAPLFNAQKTHLHSYLKVPDFFFYEVFFYNFFFYIDTRGAWIKNEPSLHGLAHGFFMALIFPALWEYSCMRSTVPPLFSLCSTPCVVGVFGVHSGFSASSCANGKSPFSPLAL